MRGGPKQSPGTGYKISGSFLDINACRYRQSQAKASFRTKKW